MAGSTHQNAVNSPRAEVGEVDTRAPFKSVKAAVNLFGELKAFSTNKSAAKKTKPQPIESTLALESELLLAQTELDKLTEQLLIAGTARDQALLELENGEKIVKNLHNKLKSIDQSRELTIKLTKNAKEQSERSKEIKSCDIHENGLNWRLELDDAKEHYTVILAELDATKQELKKTKKEFETFTDEKIFALQQEAEAKNMANANREKAAQLSKELAAVQESLVHMKLATLQKKPEEKTVLPEKDVSRQVHGCSMEEIKKMLASLKNKFDLKTSVNLHVKLAQTENEIESLQNELENSKLSVLNSVASVTEELDRAKNVLLKVLEEKSSFKNSLQSLRLELENIRKEHFEFKEKVQIESVHILKEKKTNLDVASARELEAKDVCKELILSIQTAYTEPEDAEKGARLTTISTEELKEENEATLVIVDEVEKQLPVALPTCTSESNHKITISAKELQSLKHTVEEVGSLAKMKMVASFAQEEAARVSENDAINRLKAIQKEVEMIRTATEEALKTSEIAEAARKVVEGELKRWREMEHKTPSEAACCISSETELANSATPRSRSLNSNVSESSEEKKTSTAKKGLMHQLSSIFQRKKHKVEGSPSYLSGNKLV